MKGDLSRSRWDRWVRPAGRGSSYHMGIRGESETKTSICGRRSQDQSRSIRRGRRRNADLLSGPRSGLCRRRTAALFGRMQLVSILEPWRLFSLRLRSENNRHRVYQSCQSLQSGFRWPGPWEGGSSPIPAVAFVEGSSTRTVPGCLYWVDIFGRGGPYDMARKYP